MLSQNLLLDAARDSLGVGTTDYRLAKIMDLSTSHMSALRKGRIVMSPDLAIRLADLAHIDEAYAVAAIERERALRDPNGNTQLAGVFERIARRFAGKVAGIVAVLVLVLNLAPTRVHASNATYVVDQAIPYAKWRRRRFTAVKPVLA